MATEQKLSRKSVSTAKVNPLCARFEALAEAIDLRYAGLGGATIYRDSQFDLAVRPLNLKQADKVIARAAFNDAFDRRVIREWPNHPHADISRRNLKNGS